jgi:hypothetical protein
MNGGFDIEDDTGFDVRKYPSLSEKLYNGFWDYLNQ